MVLVKVAVMMANNRQNFVTEVHLCLHRVLRARAPMMRALVMYALADASSCKAANKLNNIAQITAQKLKQRNHLKENVKETIWTERSCVYFDETAVVESLIGKTAWFENSRMLT